MTAPGPESAAASRWPTWVALSALTSTFTLSQAFRTLPAVVVGQIGAEFAASPQAIGTFAAAFAVAFGAMQLVVGVALDRYGPRKTLSALFPLAALGCAVSALAPTFGVLVLGQAILGVACAPAYLSTLIFVVRRYPAGRFAALSGITMSAGGIGMLITSTPLAWAVQTFGWRVAFVILGVLSAVSFAACFVVLDDRREEGASRETLVEAVRGIGPILRMPQTLGILCLGAVFYGVLLTVRTPWIVPLFETRHGFSLVEAGNVVLIVSFAMVVSPLPFGRLDPGGRRRRYLMIGTIYCIAALIAGLGIGGTAGPVRDLVLVTAFAALSGVAMLEYPDVRSSFSVAIVGRAIALLNMSMFFGVALVQWLAGSVAGLALARGADPLGPIFCLLAALLVAATTAYWLLPWPKVFDAPAEPQTERLRER